MKTIGAWFATNLPLVVVFAVLSPFLGWLSFVSRTESIFIGMFLAFPIAALILLDFAKRGTSADMFDSDGRMQLGPSFLAATHHTFWHAAWPHALNVAYSLGYTCLFFAFGQSHPHVMLIWLATVLIFTILRDPQLMTKLLRWELWIGFVGLGMGLWLLTMIQTGKSHLARDMNAGELIAWNVVLVIVASFIWLAVRQLHLRKSTAILVGLLCFAAASWILRDFSMHAGQLTLVNDKIDLKKAYDRALFHTIAYAAWPHALNIFFSLAFAIFASLRSVPTAMALWLAATVLVPLLYHVQEFVSSWQSPMAMVCMGLAGFLFWRLTK